MSSSKTLEYADANYDMKGQFWEVFDRSYRDLECKLKEVDDPVVEQRVRSLKSKQKEGLRDYASRNPNTTLTWQDRPVTYRLHQITDMMTLLMGIADKLEQGLPRPEEEKILLTLDIVFQSLACEGISEHAGFPLEEKSTQTEETTQLPNSDSTPESISQALLNLTTKVDSLERKITEESHISNKSPPILKNTTQAPPSFSYASIAGRNSEKTQKPRITKPAPRPATTKPAIILSGASEATTHEKILTSFSKVMKFQTLDFAPAKVLRISGSKVRVEFEKSDHMKTALKKLSTPSPDATPIKAEPARLLKPMVVLKGIPRGIDRGDLAHLMRQQNPEIRNSVTPDEIQFKFERRNRNSALYNAVFITSPRAFKIILKLQKINIDYSRVHADEFSPFIQCFRCREFGHTRAKCTNPEVCPHCAEEHPFNDCPHKNEKTKLCCNNCRTFNTRYKIKGEVSHRADSTTCPRYISVSRRIKDRVDYGPAG